MTDKKKIDDIENETIEIDQDKLFRMIKRISTLEHENSKTQKKKDKEMRKAIQDIIEEEADKCY